MNKLDDQLFGTKRDEPSVPKQESKLDDPMFGRAKAAEDPYTATSGSAQKRREERDQKAFEKKLQRETKYGRVSQDTRSKLISESINSFVNQVISQKSASTQANNRSSLELQTNQSPTVSISQPTLGNDIGAPAKEKPRPQTPQIQIPAPPDEGTHVLGVVEGEIQWIATEDC